MGQPRSVYLLHTPGHWQAMLPLQEASTAGLTGPVVACAQEEFMVFGILPDNSCMYGAFFVAAARRKLLDQEGVLGCPGSIDDNTDTSAQFTFVQAIPELMTELDAGMNFRSNKLLSAGAAVTLEIKGQAVDFFQPRQAQGKWWPAVLLQRLKMVYSDREWVLCNIFYNRGLTKGHYVAFLTNPQKEIDFVCLRADSPLRPAQPYAFLVKSDMDLVTTWPMTKAIEAQYKDEFEFLASGNEEKSGSQPVRARTGTKRRSPRSVSTRHAADKKQKAPASDCEAEDLPSEEQQVSNVLCAAHIRDRGKEFSEYVRYCAGACVRGCVCVRVYVWVCVCLAHVRACVCA